jgi:hypothetical protein
VSGAGGQFRVHLPGTARDAAWTKIMTDDKKYWDHLRGLRDEVRDSETDEAQDKNRAALKTKATALLKTRATDVFEFIRSVLGPGSKIGDIRRYVARLARNQDLLIDLVAGVGVYDVEYETADDIAIRAIDAAFSQRAPAPVAPGGLLTAAKWAIPTGAQLSQETVESHRHYEEMGEALAGIHRNISDKRE